MGRSALAPARLAVSGACLVLAACSGGTPASAAEGRRVTSEQHAFEIRTVATGLTHPWALAFLPEGRALVTERPGTLQLIEPATGERRAVDGVPRVAAVGQGGLLDVELHPDYPDEPWIYLTYAATLANDRHATHLGRGRLDADGARLADFEVLHVAEPGASGGRHFGSRIAFGPDDHLYMTTGDRGSRHGAQEGGIRHGKTLRLAADGSIPADNPFVDDPGTHDAIYSLGHRNAQGMAVDPRSGAIWQAEHGPRSGDEINRVEAGGNFGWPLATYGREYSDDSEIGDFPDERDDLVPPVHYWMETSFSPSGMAFYAGDAFPGWRGDAFVGSLARTNLTRLVFDDGDDIVAEETLLDDFGWRIRAVEVGPDGGLHLLVDAPDAPWLRLVPAD